MEIIAKALFYSCLILGTVSEKRLNIHWEAIDAQCESLDLAAITKVIFN